MRSLTAAGGEESGALGEQALKDFTSCQALTEGQDTESNIASETSKIEKENPGTKGQSCRKGFFRRSFEFTGKLSTFNKTVSLPSSEV